MLTFASKYGGNIHSQNGEDGIIEEVLKRIKPTFKEAIEFGATDGFYCSNTANLKGWVRHLYDIYPKDTMVSKFMVTVDNVNELPRCTLWSCDVDGNDYAIWMAYKGQPDIVIIEINSSLPPTEPHFMKSTGSSYRAMLNLGITKGYFLLCHTGNLIFLLDKHRALFPEIDGNGIDNYELYFNTSWL